MSGARGLQSATITLHAALILGLIAWSSTITGAVLALLLLAPLRGMVGAKLRTFRWTSMLLCIYCSALLADGYARPAEQPWAFGLAAIAAVEFVAVVLYVRRRQREEAL